MAKFSKKDNRCPNCRLHTERCICAEIPSLELTTRLALIMHRREVIKPTSTGPLALRALPNHQLYIHGHQESPLDLTPLHNEGRRVLCLYPGDGARPLTPELLAEDSRPITLIVPDGTWGQASRMAKRVPGVKEAEPVILPEGGPTEWGIREEPRLGGLATFEAIARALGMIEGRDVQETLEKLFRRMVEVTIAMRGIVPELHQKNIEPTEALPPIEILFEDEHIVAVNKPSGAIVHRGWANDREPVLQRLRDQLGLRLHTVHRLDRATSGALIFAKTSEAARELQALFDDGQVDKRYLALSRGRRAEERRIDVPLRKDKQSERKDAATDVRLVAAFERYGLYEAVPVTGRTHQIRKHFKHIRQPLIGDTRYGTGEHNRFFRENHNFSRLALHCHRLRLPHPKTGEALTINAPLPPELSALFEALALNEPLTAFLETGVIDVPPFEEPEAT